MLIEHNVNVLAEDDGGKTAFDYAYSKQDTSMMKLLIVEGNFPLSQVQKKDSNLYAAIQKSGVKAIDDWFHFVKMRSKKGQNQAPAKTSDAAESTSDTDYISWIASTILIGYVVYTLMSAVTSTRNAARLAPQVPVIDPAIAYQNTRRIMAARLLHGTLQECKNKVTMAAIQLSSFFTSAEVLSGNFFREAIRGSAVHFLQAFNNQKSALENAIGASPLANDQIKSMLLKDLTQTYYAFLKELFIAPLTEYFVMQQEVGGGIEAVQAA